MDKKALYIVIGTTSLIAVISIASAISLSSKNKAAQAQISSLADQLASMEAHEPTPVEPQIIYLTDTGDTNELTTLRSQLAEKEAVLETLASRASNTNRPPRESWEDRMARMKEEEPEEYAEMIQRREERQQEMRYSLAERTATFMDLDTSMMTEEERANHELLVEKMAKVWELTEQFQDPEAAPDREAMRELFTEMNEARPLMRDERTVMFKQLGTELGYEGQDAEDFATHVEDIIGATSLQMPGRGGRGGGGRGGDGGGRGGGGGR